MQFREQGKKIQCIRSTYEPVTKRSHQKVVGTLDRLADKLPSAGLENFTDAERLQLVAWFDARQASKAEYMSHNLVMGAAASLVQLSASIKVIGAAMTDAEAAATWRALAEVGKALRKAGHPKPKRERSASVATAASAVAD